MQQRQHWRLFKEGVDAGLCAHTGQAALCGLLWSLWKKGKVIPGGRSSPVCDAESEVLCPRLENVIVLRELWRTPELGPREPAEVVPACPGWPSTWVQVSAFILGLWQLKMLFWHRGALQLHGRSLKVVTNLHETEQTAVILIFNEEAQPAEIASSATLALQFHDVFFATWIKMGSGWWDGRALTLSLPYKSQSMLWSSVLQVGNVCHPCS